MTLRERILIVLCMAFCGYWGLEYVVYAHLVTPKLERLESSAAQQQIQRCQKAINAQAVMLQEFAVQLSSSEDLQSLLQQSVMPEAISARADIFGLADESGQWVRLVNSARFSEAPDAGDLLNQMHKGSIPLVASPPVLFAQKGIVTSMVGPLLVGSSPCSIVRPEGLCRGTLIVGRFVTPEMIAALEKQIYNLNFV